MARKVPRPGTFWVREEDVSQVPFVGQVPVAHGDADGQYLAHRLRVYHVVVRVRVGSGGVGCSGESEEVGVVLLLLESSVEPLRGRPTSSAYMHARPPPSQLEAIQRWSAICYM